MQAYLTLLFHWYLTLQNAIAQNNVERLVLINELNYWNTNEK
jgi:hypothetical protein